MGYSKLTYDEYVNNPYKYGTKIPLWAYEIADKGYKGISAIDFYDDIFGEDLETERLPEDYVTGEYGGIAIERVKKLDKNGNVVLNDKGHEVYIGKRITVTKGNQPLYDLIDRSDNFCIIAPISYAGRIRTNENARFMYAFCIEVDNINPKGGLSELFYSWERDVQPLPKPTYIVCSGNGLHLYYVFERPIPLWRNIFEKFTEAKKYFTPRIWTKYITTAHDKIQYGSVNQPFRIVGSRTKNDGFVLAFEIGEKVTIEYLNKFLPTENQLDCIYKSSCTLEEAKKLYPEWYKRRIEDGKPRGHWTRHKGIYHNWKQKILDGAIVGTRYNCLENLCSLAVQCTIPPYEVEKDCREIAEYFERLTIEKDNHFTEYDILCALRTYYTHTEQAYRRRIEFISKKTGILLVANKRNYRSQEMHLKGARALQNIYNPNWREGNGRPVGSGTKEKRIKRYIQSNPSATITQIAKELGVSRTTVYKYYEEYK